MTGDDEGQSSFNAPLGVNDAKRSTEATKVHNLLDLLFVVLIAGL